MMAGETVKSGGGRIGAGRKAKPDAEGRMSLLGHLSELRRRLIICLVCFLVCFSACLSQAEWFTQLLLSRGKQFTFVYIAPTELFMSYIRIALVGGVVVTVPVISYQIWKFIRPGLRGKECVVVLLVMTAGLGLFALGAFFRLFRRAAHSAQLFCPAGYHRLGNGHGVHTGIHRLPFVHHDHLRRRL